MGREHLFRLDSTGNNQQTSTNIPPESMHNRQESHRPLQPRGPEKHHKINVQKLIGFVLLAILVIVGGGIGLYLINPNILPTTQSTAAAGNEKFATPPLSSKQIADIQHLAERLHYRQLAGLYVSRMSLDDEIGQLLMVEYRPAQQYDTDLDTMLNQQHVGGVIMYREQINTTTQTQHDTSLMQQRSPIPVFIAVDEEGWNVNRLTNLYPNSLSYFKDADDIRATGSPQVAANEGQKVAAALKALGINMNLAPDVDVSTDNNYIGYDGRSFGATPDEVIKYAGPYMKALQANGIIGCIKHFPGIGSLLRGNDPHAVLPTITESKSQLYQNDLATFTHFIQSTDPQEQASVVMPTDVMVPAIDPVYPAELSHTFVTNILRNQLHFDGVILTDSLIMGGVQINGQSLTLAQAGVLALQAGDDMLMGADNPTDVAAMVAAIKAALQNKTLSKAQLDDAATRILTLKMSSHLMPATPPQG